MDRKKAREYTFVILFQYKFQPEEVSEIIADFFENYDAKKQEDYIKGTVEGVVEHINEIDEKIIEYAKGWTIDRINSVSLAALRLGTYELMFSKGVPAPVAVNEAVNIVRKYGGEETLGFVNGILGSIQKQLYSKTDD